VFVPALRQYVMTFCVNLWREGGRAERSGFYVAFSGGTGAFQGSFHVDYVSPYVTSLFGDPNIWQQPGSDSFSTSSNNFVTKSFTDTATLGQGGITFQVTPEPGALAIFGTGVLVVAAVIRRKLR